MRAKTLIQDVLYRNMKYSTIIGNYYRILGWISVIGTVVGLATAYWTDRVFFDLSFIIWFWIGKALRQQSSTARKWAIVLSSICTGIIVLGLITRTGSANFGRHEFSPPQAEYYLLLLILFILLGLPGLLLLSKRARDEFKNEQNK